jgi:hypothetical protein
MVLGGLAYRQFPELSRQQEVRTLEGASDVNEAALESTPSAANIWREVYRVPARLFGAAEAFVRDLLEFSRLPVFWSTCSYTFPFAQMRLIPDFHV